MLNLLDVNFAFRPIGVSKMCHRRFDCAEALSSAIMRVWSLCDSFGSYVCGCCCVDGIAGPVLHVYF